MVILVGLLLRAPRRRGAGKAQAVQQSCRDDEWKEVLKTPPFDVMYIVRCGWRWRSDGDCAIGAHRERLRDRWRLSVAGWTSTLPALTFALTIDRVLNGACRPFLGWVSDQIGRENTMFIAFLLEGIGIFALLYFGTDPVLFVILSGLVFFAWGEIYSLFPATWHRPLREEVRDDELRDAVHGERHRCALGAPCQCAYFGDGQLARGVRRGSDPQYRRRHHGIAGPQADAHPDDGARVTLAHNRPWMLIKANVRFGS